VIKNYIYLLLTLSPLHAFEDSDIDGVADSNDLCPNSSLEDIVDVNGCAEIKKYLGELTFMVGSDINFGETTTTDYNLFSSYSYKRWSFSIANGEESSLDKNNKEIQSIGDLYLSTSYSRVVDDVYAQLTMGMKVAIGEDEVSSGENDYFTNLGINYALNERIILLSSLNYTFTEDSNETTYANPLGYSLGIGYIVNEKWYSSLRYQQADSIYRDSEDYKSFSLFNSYNFRENLFGTLNYTRGLDDLSYRDRVSFKLGVTFE